MNEVLKYSWYFVLLSLTQSLILNQLEIGLGIQIFVLPLYILLLPFEINVFVLMILAFFLGLSVDIMSNTFGLHASSLVTIAALRPFIFKIFAPRDGYDNLYTPNIFSMGRSWFIKTFGLLLLIHHLWYFLFEIFKLSEILFVLQKTILSLVLSFIICVLFQFIMIKKAVEK